MRSVCYAIFVWTLGATAQAETLSGVVYCEDGKPADRATINIAAIFHAPPIRLNATADANGYFEIDLPRLKNSERYLVAARWKNQGADVMDALDRTGSPKILQGEQLPTMTLRLRSAGRLRGKVLQAEDDQPIAGVKLFLDTGEVVTSDADGAFELTGLPMKDHTLVAAPRGRVRQNVLFDTTLQPNAELELRLARGATIKGKITDEEGQPIPGAYLSRMVSGNALSGNGWNELCQADGSFEYGVSSEKLFYFLIAMAPGYQIKYLSPDVKTATDVIEQTIRLKRQPVSALEVSLEENETEIAAPPLTKFPRREITGSVEHEGRPIAGATIRWLAFSQDPSVKIARTNTEGHFSLAGVRGAGAVLVMADGHAPRLIPVEAENARVTAQLSRGVAFRGTVRGPTGQPIEDVRVVAQLHAPQPGFCNPAWLDERAAHTNAKGEFSLEAMPADGVTFDLDKENFADVHNAPLKRGDGNEIQLSTSGAIRGRVVDARFDPVRNFKIRLRTSRVRQAKERFGGHSSGADSWGVRYTHYDGEFVLASEEAHTWRRCIFSSPGHGLAILDRVKSDPLDQLPPADNLIIKLKPWVPLTVRVSDAKTGRAVEDALVLFLEDAPELAKNFEWGYNDLQAIRRRTNSAGVAVYSEPGCEDGTIIVCASGFARRRVAWTDGAKEVKFSLDPQATLTGEVRRKGEPVKEGFAKLASATDEVFNVDLQETGGRFTFDQLPAGEFRLSINDPNGDSLNETKILLKEGETRTEKIVLEPNPQNRQRDQKRAN